MGFFGRKVSFRATKIIRVPVKVSFRRFDGRKVSFRATKAIRVPKKVGFFTRRKKWY